MINLLRPVALTALLALPLPAISQETPPEGAVPEEGGQSLIEDGARLLLEGLSQELQPLMQGLATEMEPRLREFAEEIRPMLEDLSGMIGDLDQYHAPEKLPNGDIILRRKVPDTPPAEDEAEPGSEVEL